MAERLRGRGDAAGLVLSLRPRTLCLFKELDVCVRVLSDMRHLRRRAWYTYSLCAMGWVNNLWVGSRSRRSDHSSFDKLVVLVVSCFCLFKHQRKSWMALALAWRI